MAGMRGLIGRGVRAQEGPFEAARRLGLYRSLEDELAIQIQASEMRQSLGALPPGLSPDSLRGIFDGRRLAYRQWLETLVPYEDWASSPAFRDATDSGDGSGAAPAVDAGARRLAQEYREMFAVPAAP
jgi:hypothetical protein